MIHFLVIVTPDGSCELRATPEDPAAGQPCANESQTVQAVIDGRIDNAEELVAAFDAAGRPLRARTDAALLLAAYDLWGDGCAERLRGDFAFAIWDAPRRRLVCARDILGSRPLYVQARGGGIAVASEIAPLLRLPGASREPNEALLAEYLNGTIVHRTDTVWRDIDRLLPAHLLMAEGGRVATRCYWQPDPHREVRYRDDNEYGEHLADLIRSAIRPLVCGRVPFGVMLSGGLDSSSIVGALHDMALAGPQRPLPTFSVTTPGEPWDEVEYLDAVTAKWPVTSVRRRHVEGTPEYYAAKTVAYQDLPPFPNGVMADAMFQAAADAGVAVLLTGLWSDEWLTGSFLHYTDLIQQRRFVELWRHFRAQSDRADGFRPDSLFRSMIWPLVPRPAREAIKHGLGRDGVAPWVNRAFAARTGLPARIRPAAPPLRFPTRAKTESWTGALGAFSIRGTELERRTTAGFGIETRHPYADRRILEFGLALPEDQRWRGRFPKPALRNAARAWLPPAVLERSTYTGASSVILRAVQGQFAAGLWDNAASVRQGWINLPALHTAFEEMMGRYRSGGDSYMRLASPLWHACSVELFARHVLEESHG